MAKSIVSNTNKNNTLNNPAEDGGSFDNKNNTAVSELAHTFVQEMKQSNKDYFDDTSGEKVARDFIHWLEVRGEGDDIFDIIKKTKNIDMMFADIMDEKIPLQSLLDQKKYQTVKSIVHTSMTETQACNNLILDLDRQHKLHQVVNRSGSPTSFCTTHDIQVQNGQIIMGPNSDLHNIADILSAWKDHVEGLTASNDYKQALAKTCKVPDEYDNTEKIYCISTLRTLRSRLQVYPQTIRDRFAQLCGTDVFLNPVPASLPQTTLDGLSNIVRALLQDVETDESLGLTPGQKKSLENLLQRGGVSLKDCWKHAKESQELFEEDTTDSLSKKVSQLNNHTRKVFNKLTTAKVASKLENSIETIDQSIDAIKDTFNFPSDLMGGFFKQFLDMNALPTIGGTNKKVQSLESVDPVKFQELSQLRKQYTDLNTTRNELPVSDPAKQELGQKIKDIRDKMTTIITAFESNSPDWKRAIENMAQLVNQACQTIDRPGIGKQLSAVIKKRHENHRNVDKLSAEEHALLLQASVYKQLASVKEKGLHETMNIDFEQYSQSIIDLYDVNKKDWTLQTPSGPMVLKFKSKKIIPIQERDRDAGGEVTLDTISKKKGLPLEFELELSDLEQINLMRKIYGKYSIMDKKYLTDEGLKVVGNQQGYLTENTPTTLTIGGETYRDVYISQKSPAIDDGLPEGSDCRYVYDRPIGLHDTDRKLITRKLENGKEVPLIFSNEDIKNHRDGTKTDRSRVYPTDQVTIELGESPLSLSLNGDQLNLLSMTSLIGSSQQANNIQDDDYKQFADLAKQLGMIDEQGESNQEKQAADNYLGVAPDKGIQQSQSNKEDSPKTPREELQKKLASRYIYKSSDEASQKLELESNPLSEGSILYTRVAGQSEKDILPKANLRVKLKVKSLDDTTISFEMSGAHKKLGGLEKKVFTFPIAKFIAGLDDVFKDISYISPTNAKELDFDTMKGKLTGLYPSMPGWQDRDTKYLKYITEKDNKIIDTVNSKHYQYFYHEDSGSAVGDPAHYKVSVFYKVEIKDGVYNVTCNDISQVKEDPKTKKQYTAKSNYTFSMDRASFLLFLSERGLKGATKEEVEGETTKDGKIKPGMKQLEEQKNEGTLPQRNVKDWFSLGSAFSFFKGKFGTVVDQFKKRLEEDAKDELEFKIIHQGQLFRKISSALPFLDYFDIDAFDDLQDEADTKAKDLSFKKIEEQLNFLNSFHHSWAPWIGTTKGIVKDVGTRKAFEFLKNVMDAEDAGQGHKVTFKKRCKAAAALVYMLDKKGAYAKEMATFPPGSYVKALFGTHFYNQFMVRYRQEASKLTSNTKGVETDQDRFARFEFNFIIDGIRNGPDNPMKFGDNAARAGGDAHYLLNLYGRSYASKLNESLEKSMQADNDAFEQNKKKNDIIHTKNEVRDHLSARRTKEALGEMKALLFLPKTYEESDYLRQAAIAGGLSGTFTWDTNRDEKYSTLRNTLRGGKIFFSDWFLRPDAPQKIFKIFDFASGGKFSETFRYNTKDEKNKKYDPKNFGNENFMKQITGDKGFVKSFYTRREENPDIVKDIKWFLNHEEPEDDESFISLVNSDPALPKMYKGKPVDDATIGLLGEMYGTRYENKFTGHEVPVDRFIRKHPHGHFEEMMAQQYNKFDSDGKFLESESKKGDGDACLDMWGAHEARIKDVVNKTKGNPFIGTKDRHKLMFFTREFFRIFSGIGNIKGDTDSEGLEKLLEQVYRAQKYKKKAKEYPEGSAQRAMYEANAKRLIYHHMFAEILGGGRLKIEQICTDTCRKYAEFFYDNIDGYDNNMKEKYVLGSKTDLMNPKKIEGRSKYVPQHERDKLTDAEKRSSDSRHGYSLVKDINSTMLNNNKQSITSQGQSIDAIAGVDMQEYSRTFSEPKLKAGTGVFIANPESIQEKKGNKTDPNFDPALYDDDEQYSNAT